MAPSIPTTSEPKSDRFRQQSLLRRQVIVAAASPLDALQIIIQHPVRNTWNPRRGEGLDCFFPLALPEKNNSLPELVATALPLRRERVLRGKELLEFDAATTAGTLEKINGATLHGFRSHFIG